MLPNLITNIIAKFDVKLNNLGNDFISAIYQT
jgi:hypothetical protein